MEVELREFIKQALVNIVGGVSDAAADIKTQNNGAIISPRVHAPSGEHALQIAPEDGFGIAFPLKFDLSITVTSGESQRKDMGGGFKISVLSARAGVEETDTATKTAVQRIQFTVPVKFPQTPWAGNRPR
jgi:hypothetical protein